MWKDKLKEIIYILENSNVNEIDLSFWGTRYRVVKNPGTALNAPANNNSVALALDQSKDNSESVKDYKDQDIEFLKFCEQAISENKVVEYWCSW